MTKNKENQVRQVLEGAFDKGILKANREFLDFLNLFKETSPSNWAAMISTKKREIKDLIKTWENLKR